MRENSNSVSEEDIKIHEDDKKFDDVNIHNPTPPIEDKLLTEDDESISKYVGVILNCLLIAFGGFMFGFDVGTIGGFFKMGNFMKRFGSYHHGRQEYYFTNVRTGLLVSMFNVGCCIGGIALGGLCDKYGRKPALTIVAGIYMIGVLIQITCMDHPHVWVQYLIGRIIAGFGFGGISVFSPLMLGETAPAKLRSICVSFYQLVNCFGIFIGYCCNYGTKKYSDNSSAQWRVALGLCFLWALTMMGGITFVPESARYLVQKDRIEEARKTLSILNKVPMDDPLLEKELDIIVSAVQAERIAGKASFRELFSTKTKVFQRLVMGVILQSLQQLTGDNYFFYYGTIIFTAVGLKDSYQTSIIIGIVNFASTCMCLIVVKKFGRRTVLMFGSITMTVCMVIYSAIGVKKLYPHGRSEPASKSAGDVMIVFTCLYIFFFATTWGPLPYVVCAESYPLRVKSKCIAITQGTNWIWGFLISFFTPFITGAIHFSYGFVFMGCLIFMTFFVFFVIPETKDLTLEEVDELWQDDVLPWRSSNWVPAARRGEDYDDNDLRNNQKVGLKRFF
ncbi:related to Hexose transporter 2 [Hanseniaspora guilliermondii]|uniref:Related to Hexose transporter 2 n=1 Tax=Hanseniaspora guilliermondii TaxID=56406 RepID=A0A1L0CTV4_9ASCO|nr:related to Hexose transporter 2 [Hanseniaspora guilliermondii]